MKIVLTIAGGILVCLIAEAAGDATAHQFVAGWVGGCIASPILQWGFSS